MGIEKDDFNKNSEEVVLSRIAVIIAAYLF